MFLEMPGSLERRFGQRKEAREVGDSRSTCVD